MKIINGKEKVSQPNNVITYYENCYIKEINAFMLTWHGGGHENTKLFYYKVGQTKIPVLHKWCDDHKIGLEDPYVSKKINGWYYMSAEGKPWGSSGEHQINIYTFKSQTINAKEWIYCPNLTIKPTSRSFDNCSMSSPINFYQGGTTFIQYFECRGYNWNAVQGVYTATTSYAIIDTLTDTIKYRHTAPIVNDVCDDAGFKDGYYWLSVHHFNNAITNPDRKWSGYVYKSKNFDKGFEFAYKPTFNGQTIGEIYFTDTNKVMFWNTNKLGMWEGYLDSGTQTTTTTTTKSPGTTMKQIASISGIVLSAQTVKDAVRYEWQFVKPDGSSEWFAPGQIIDIPEKHRINGRGFFFYAKFADGSRVQGNSNTVIYGSVVTTTTTTTTTKAPTTTTTKAPSGNNEVYKENIRVFANNILAEIDKVDN